MIDFSLKSIVAKNAHAYETVQLTAIFRRHRLFKLLFYAKGYIQCCQAVGLSIAIVYF